MKRLLCLLVILEIPCLAQTLQVNGPRIVQHLQALSEFGRNPQGGVSRVAYTEADRQGREYAMRLMRDAGLEVTVDAAGNIVGSRPGSDASLKPLLIGSHIDSVPEGGNYDGDVGSLSAIEVAQTLNEKHVNLRHPLQVVIFQNEEGGTIGSKAIGSGLTGAVLDRTSQSGKTMREGIRFIGGDPDKVETVRRQPGSIAGYFELHIEQGGTLEQQKINIGVVEGIVGILHSDVTIDGFANHAGTTPMNQRHDTLLSAARFIQKVNEIVTSIPGRQVGTVGWIRVQPGAYNVIPGRTVLGLELRDLDSKKIDEMFSSIRAQAGTIGQMNGTKISFTEPVITDPALTDKGFQKLIDSTARQLGFTTLTMPSGAGPDAQEISRPQDIENGANVLLNTVVAFDRMK
jgi:beta-ureidopropionase / N-carbamoyl-L-amino-acid hydrolase